MKLGDNIQSGDFKGEKHVPVLEFPEKVKSGELIKISASVGKEISHPNTPQHYIAWMQFFYKSDDGKFITELGKTIFASHGESANPAETGPSATEPNCSVMVRLTKSGTIIAQSYCNIHGLWESSQRIIVE